MTRQPRCLSDGTEATLFATAPIRYTLTGNTSSRGREMAATRRLAAILACDVAGYSRLMRADEEGTHQRVKAHLRELVDPTVHKHRGRIVKFTGDGMLAEFSSIVEAVACAPNTCAAWTIA